MIYLNQVLLTLILLLIIIAFIAITAMLIAKSTYRGFERTKLPHYGKLENSDSFIREAMEFLELTNSIRSTEMGEKKENE